MRIATALVPLLALAIPACVAEGPEPDTDPSGGGGGKGDGTSCTPGAPGEVDDCFGYAKVDMAQLLSLGVTTQTDGKILLFGTGLDAKGPTPTLYRPFVRRLLANGEPDSTFTATLPERYYDSDFHPIDIAEHPDGHLIVAGAYGSAGSSRHSILHLLPSGAPDTDVQQQPVPLVNSTSSQANKVLVEPDGSYYVVGTTECVAIFTCDWREMFVARFDRTGKLDTTFGTNGFTLVKSGTHTRPLDAIRAGDATYVLGVETSPIYVSGQEATYSRVVVSKLDATGALDTSFGNGTPGIFAWSDGVSRYGNFPQTFRVNPDNTITVETKLGAPQLLTIAADGKTSTAKAYREELQDVSKSRFGRDGMFVGMTETYPTPQFARFAADGTQDTSFASVAIEVTDTPEDTVFLSDNAVLHESADAWLFAGQIYMRDADPASQIVLFRLWK